MAIEVVNYSYIMRIALANFRKKIKRYLSALRNWKARQLSKRRKNRRRRTRIERKKKITVDAVEAVDEVEAIIIMTIIGATANCSRTTITKCRNIHRRQRR